MKLIKELIRLRKKGYRRQYKIKPCVRFHLDTNHYVMALIPTIFFIPWIYRYPSDEVFDIHWLNFHILIGKFVYIGDKNDIDGTNA